MELENLAKRVVKKNRRNFCSTLYKNKVIKLLFCLIWIYRIINIYKIILLIYTKALILFGINSTLKYSKTVIVLDLVILNFILDTKIL